MDSSRRARIRRFRTDASRGYDNESVGYLGHVTRDTTRAPGMSQFGICSAIIFRPNTQPRRYWMSAGNFSKGSFDVQSVPLNEILQNAS